MTSNDWWAKKLNAPAQPSQPQSYPAQRPMPQMPQMPQVPQQQMPAQTLPASAYSGKCPGCGSGNYGGATPETRPRCYDCGYPLTQTGTGMPGMSTPSGGPTQASRQVASGGWNPTTIVDRIG
jgi:hypothetical protein